MVMLLIYGAALALITFVVVFVTTSAAGMLLSAPAALSVGYAVGFATMMIMGWPFCFRARGRRTFSAHVLLSITLGGGVGLAAWLIS